MVFSRASYFLQSIGNFICDLLPDDLRKRSKTANIAENLFKNHPESTLSPLPTDLLAVLMSYMEPTAACQCKTISKLFHTAFKMLKTSPLYFDYWKTYSYLHFPESTRHIKPLEEKKWVDFYGEQSLAKKNLFESKIQASRSYYEEMPFYGTRVSMDNNGRLVVTSTDDYLKLWDFEDESEPLKFDYYFDLQIRQALISSDWVCALTIHKNLYIWKLSELLFNSKPLILNIGDQSTNVMLVRSKFFYKNQNRLYLLDLELITPETNDIYSLAVPINKINHITQINDNKIIGHDDEKIVILDFDSLEVLCEQKPDKNFNFAFDLLIFHNNKLITLQYIRIWNILMREARYDYKFFIYDTVKNVRISNTDTEIVTSTYECLDAFSPWWSYIFNDNFICLVRENPEIAYNFATGKRRIYAWHFPNISLFPNYGYAKAINGILISTNRFFDLRREVYSNPNLPTLSDYFQNRILWIGTKIVYIYNSSGDARIVVHDYLKTGTLPQHERELK